MTAKILWGACVLLGLFAFGLLVPSDEERRYRARQEVVQ